MKRKIFLTIAFLVSLIPMLTSQYGGIRGVREISGLNNLWNPIGILAVILFIVGLWAPFKNAITGKVLAIIGLVGILASEIYIFLTWPIPTYQDAINLSYSFENAFPEFYIGLATSALMLITYVCMMTLPDRQKRAARRANRVATKQTRSKAQSTTKGPSISKKSAQKPATRK